MMKNTLFSIVILSTIFSFSALAEDLSPIATTPDGKSIVACYAHVIGDNPVNPGTQATWDTIIIRNSVALRAKVNNSIVHSNNDLNVYQYTMKRTLELNRLSLLGEKFEVEGKNVLPELDNPKYGKWNPSSLPVPSGTFFTARGYQIGLFLYGESSAVFANVVTSNSHDKDLVIYNCTDDQSVTSKWLTLVFKPN